MTSTPCPSATPPAAGCGSSPQLKSPALVSSIDPEVENQKDILNRLPRNQILLLEESPLRSPLFECHFHKPPKEPGPRGCLACLTQNELHTEASKDWQKQKPSSAPVLGNTFQVPVANAQPASRCGRRFQRPAPSQQISVGSFSGRPEEGQLNHE